MPVQSTSISPVASLGLVSPSPRSRTRPPHGNDVLGADVLGGRVHALAFRWVEHDLRQSPAIAQIHEDDASVVATRVYPSHQDHIRACIGLAQIPAPMGSSVLELLNLQCAHLRVPPSLSAIHVGRFAEFHTPGPSVRFFPLCLDASARLPRVRQPTGAVSHVTTAADRRGSSRLARQHTVNSLDQLVASNLTTDSTWAV